MRTSRASLRRCSRLRQSRGNGRDAMNVYCVRRPRYRIVRTAFPEIPAHSPGEIENKQISCPTTNRRRTPMISKARPKCSNLQKPTLLGRAVRISGADRPNPRWQEGSDESLIVKCFRNTVVNSLHWADGMFLRSRVYEQSSAPSSTYIIITHRSNA